MVKSGVDVNALISLLIQNMAAIIASTAGLVYAIRAYRHIARTEHKLDELPRMLNGWHRDPDDEQHREMHRADYTRWRDEGH